MEWSLECIAMVSRTWLSMGYRNVLASSFPSPSYRGMVSRKWLSDAGALEFYRYEFDSCIICAITQLVPWCLYEMMWWKLRTTRYNLVAKRNKSVSSRPIYDSGSVFLVGLVASHPGPLPEWSPGRCRCQCTVVLIETCTRYQYLCCCCDLFNFCFQSRQMSHW